MASIKLRNRIFGIDDNDGQFCDNEDNVERNNMTQSLGNDFTAIVGENNSSGTP